MSKFRLLSILLILLIGCTHTSSVSDWYTAAGSSGVDYDGIRVEDRKNKTILDK